MARSEILKEGGKVGSIRGAVAKAKKDSSCREVNLVLIFTNNNYTSLYYANITSALPYKEKKIY